MIEAAADLQPIYASVSTVAVLQLTTVMVHISFYHFCVFLFVYLFIYFLLGLGLGLGLGLRKRKCSQRCDRLIIEQAKTLVLGASSSLAFLNQYPLLRNVELGLR